MARKQRIGIFGGAFDPVHTGHIRIARKVLDEEYVDLLLMIPTGNPPYKTCHANPEDRWRMLVAACASDERIIPCRIELDRSGAVYAVDTLEQLRKDYPKAEFTYIIGSDALMNLHRWHRLETVLKFCTFLVFPRDGQSPSPAEEEIQRLASLGGRFRLLRTGVFPVSSSEIRSAFAAGCLPDRLDVPVLEYCTVTGLYGAPGMLDNSSAWLSSLFGELKPRRFAHSLSVAFTAKKLARIHGLDQRKAEEAGLLHDCAKYFPLSRMQQLALSHHLTDDPAFLSSTALLHSLVGAFVAEDRYGMTDPDVLEAIRYHNTGYPGMSRLAVCVCLSDSIEPLRESYPRLEEIRHLAETSLEKALLLSLESTAEYVLEKGKYLHPRTRETIAWLRTLPG